MSAQLVAMSAIVEDAACQLNILGGIKPDMVKQRQDLSDIVGEEVSSIIAKQRVLERRFEDIISQYRSAEGEVDEYKAGDQEEIDKITRELRQSMMTLCRILKANPSMGENLVKIQVERSSFEALMSQTVRELKESHFSTLNVTVEEESMRQQIVRQTIDREKEATQAVKALTNDIATMHKDTERELEDLLETIQQTKDSKQALKGATVTEIKYLGEEMSACLASEQRASHAELARQMAEVKALEDALDREESVHQKNMEHLNSVVADQEALIEKWMTTYDTHTDGKTTDLERAKKDRAQTLQELDALQKDYNKMVDVVESYHRDELARKVREKEEAEQAAAIIVCQAYIRGHQTRQRLRNPPKKKKASAKKKK